MIALSYLEGPEGQTKLPRIYQFGDFRIDTVDERLYRNGEKLNINRRTFQVLRLLVERSGEIVSKQEFFDTVWADTFVEDNSLTVAITTLRKLLGDSAKAATFIENLPRKGYRFIGEVRIIDDSPAVSSNGAKKVATPTAEVESELNFRNRKILVGILTACLLVLVGASALNFSDSRFAALSANGNQVESIAVLPFENQNPETEYLSDGLTDSIINSLAELPNLRVISRNSVFQYKGKETNIQTIGRELNVRAILTGKVVHNGDGLIITAELTDLKENRQLWGHRFERKGNDAFDVLNDISREVVERLGLNLTGDQQQQLKRRVTDSPEAYQLYLKGHFFWNKRTEDGYSKAVEFFNQALDKDPTYALAYVGLANCYAQASFKFITTKQERLELVKGALQRALEIDPDLGEAYAALALTQSFYEWDWLNAGRNYQRAIALNPNYATARHWYAEFLAIQGRFEESLSEYDRALELDPLSLPIQTDKGYAYSYARQPERSIEYLERLRKMAPGYARTYLFLLYAYRINGKFEESLEAQEIYESLEAKNYELTGTSQPDSGNLQALRNGLASQGPEGYWRETLRIVGEQNGDTFHLATIYAQLGEKEKAFENLEKAVSGGHVSASYIKATPDLDALHDDPRFAHLVRRVGLPE